MAPLGKFGISWVQITTGPLTPDKYVQCRVIIERVSTGEFVSILDLPLEAFNGEVSVITKFKLTLGDFKIYLRSKDDIENKLLVGTFTLDKVETWEHPYCLNWIDGVGAALNYVSCAIM